MYPAFSRVKGWLVIHNQENTNTDLPQGIMEVCPSCRPFSTINWVVKNDKFLCGCWPW